MDMVIQIFAYCIYMFEGTVLKKGGDGACPVNQRPVFSWTQMQQPSKKRHGISIIPNKVIYNEKGIISTRLAM